MVAGWSSLVARWAHNPKVVGSNPTPATKKERGVEKIDSPSSCQKVNLGAGFSELNKFEPDN